MSVFDGWDFTVENMEHATQQCGNQQPEPAMHLAQNGFPSENEWNCASTGSYPGDVLNDPASGQQVNNQPSEAYGSQSRPRMTPSSPENGYSPRSSAPSISPHSSSYDMSAGNSPFDAQTAHWSTSALPEYASSSHFGTVGASHASLPSLSTMTATHVDFTPTVASATVVPGVGTASIGLATTPVSDSTSDNGNTSTSSHAATDSAVKGPDAAEGAKISRYQASPINYVNGRAHFVPEISSLMDPLMNGVDVETHFRSLDEVKEHLRSKSPVAYDPTIPHNQFQKQAIVKTMVNLMGGIEYAQDNDNMIAPFAEQRYSTIRLETACWQLLEAIIDRHRDGPLMTAYANVRKSTTELESFADRLTLIMELIASHKTMCKHLLDAPYIYSLVDDPVAAQKRVEANKTLNARKGVVMKAGKQLLGRPPRGKGKKSATAPKGKGRKKPTCKKATRASVHNSNNNSDKSEQVSNAATTDINALVPILPATQAVHAQSITPIEQSGYVHPQHMVSAETFPMPPPMAFQGSNFGHPPFHRPMVFSPTPDPRMGTSISLSRPHVIPQMSDPATQFALHSGSGNSHFPAATAFNGMMYANQMGYMALSPASPPTPSPQAVFMQPRQATMASNRNCAYSDMDFPLGSFERNH
ncbi:hypothetical protein FE257_011688 [Aspergillus nanangensis]|uniref:Uncharacterized protein n=1 Tax=Aspergillus nanangensis TaxID=2582783 RepID=A0AAD4CVI3_ASPNN|nr:hypothetical protein FE257_011688 [Aspergillus nanangensis]